MGGVGVDGVRGGVTFCTPDRPDMAAAASSAPVRLEAGLPRALAESMRKGDWGPTRGRIIIIHNNAPRRAQAEQPTLLRMRPS